jgi:transcriptional regulator with XRE-family HTH domain
MEPIRYNRIKVVLVEFNISQLELAKILSVDKNTVTRWCKNHNQPALIQLYEIAKFFRIDVRNLIESTNWEKEKGPSPVEQYKAEKNKTKNESQKPALKSKNGAKKNAAAKKTTKAKR